MELQTKLELDYSPSNIIELQNGNYAIAADKYTLILDKNTYTIKQKLENHIKEINRVIETKNKKLITISRDKTLVVNELDENNNYKLIQRINEPGNINSIIELSTGELFTCNCDKNIRLYNYDENSKKYELNYTYEVKEITTHAVEVNNGKVLILTFEGDNNVIKLLSYSLQKKKIEKMLLRYSSIYWNNYESILNINNKYSAIILFNIIAIIDKENISVVQEVGLERDFINVLGLYKDSNTIIFSTLGGKNYKIGRAHV